MDLTPDMIDTVDEAGVLDGQPVKLIRTAGGYWIAVHKGKVLSGGSHPAIVKHTVSKMYSKFQPAMCKSEGFEESVVDQHSHFLSDDLRKSGHDVYSVQTGNEIEFHITKNNLTVASVKSNIVSDSLFFNNLIFPTEFTRAMAGAATEKAISCNSKKIQVK